MKELSIIMPRGAEIIIDVLYKNGYEAYVVGGCVRDSLIGRIPGDWDLTTNASPENVKSLFAKTIDTGIEHGTVTVMIEGCGYEVTTYRVDGEYKDHRHPEKVVFTRSLLEDQKRRDFTINAMAYNYNEGLKDSFGGRLDLEKGLIRCVGDPNERFREDALRILRAIRFSSQLGFEIEDNTRAAGKKIAKTLEHVSAERIQVELTKMILGDYPEKIIDAYNMNVTKVILPEFDRCMETRQETKHHKENVGIHTVEVIKGLEKNKVLRLAALFHDFGKPIVKTIDAEGVAHFKGHACESEKIAKSVLKRLRFDNETIKKVSILVKHHEDYYKEEATPENTRRLLSKLGKELFPLYLSLRRADINAQSMYKREEKLSNLKKVEEYYIESLEKNYPLSKKDLLVKGKDLIEAGIKPGKNMGIILDELLELVLTNPKLNNKETLISRALMLEGEIK